MSDRDAETPKDPPGSSANDPFTRRELKALPRGFFERPVLDVTADLLGKLLVRRDESGRTIVGRIVEVEAYGGKGVDPAAHSYRGPTPRCQVMFGPAGLAYVYATQSRCFCLNVTTGGQGGGRAVLIRAVEPLHGFDLMRARRLARLNEGPTRRRLERGRPAELAQGPGRLCMCLQLSADFNGADLTDPDGLIWLAEGSSPKRTRWTARIGINKTNPAAYWAWRTEDIDSAAVSARRQVRGEDRREPEPPFDFVAPRG
ncbi:MAG: hypothetical protein DHS20C15_13290 [Planctomycetota bacterium]|nr:MAG: hypothetical protein DHS20C15_13290 [Planctomycetota bacterium]